MKRLALALVLAIGVLSLSACEDRECLHGHTVTSTTMVYNGKTMVPAVTTTYVCDEYEVAK